MNNDNYDARKLLSLVFEVDILKIPEDASLKSYVKWDSLGHMRIILQLEEFLKRPIETEEMLSIVDLESLQKLLSC
jgi:acyl carrier protein